MNTRRRICANEITNLKIGAKIFEFTIVGGVGKGSRVLVGIKGMGIFLPHAQHPTGSMYTPRERRSDLGSALVLGPL